MAGIFNRFIEKLEKSQYSPEWLIIRIVNRDKSGAVSRIIKTDQRRKASKTGQEDVILKMELVIQSKRDLQGLGAHLTQRINMIYSNI